MQRYLLKSTENRIYATADSGLQFVICVFIIMDGRTMGEVMELFLAPHTMVAEVFLLPGICDVCLCVCVARDILILLCSV